MLRKKKKNLRSKKQMIRRKPRSLRKVGTMSLGDQAAIKKIIKESKKTKDLPRKSLKRLIRLLF